ncbi:hypothetical protein ILYODFUR_037342, partial [Ilyodon furcidens]
NNYTPHKSGFCGSDKKKATVDRKPQEFSVMSKPTRWTPKVTEPKQLPIYQHKNKLTQAVRTSTFLIVTGETGSGKTTQLPQYLHQAGKMLLLKRNFILHVFLTSEVPNVRVGVQPRVTNQHL